MFTLKFTLDDVHGIDVRSACQVDIIDTLNLACAILPRLQHLSLTFVYLDVTGTTHQGLRTDYFMLPEHIANIVSHKSGLRLLDVSFNDLWYPPNTPISRRVHVSERTARFDITLMPELNREFLLKAFLDCAFNCVLRDTGRHRASCLRHINSLQLADDQLLAYTKWHHSIELEAPILEQTKSDQVNRRLVIQRDVVRWKDDYMPVWSAWRTRQAGSQECCLTVAELQKKKSMDSDESSSFSACSETASSEHDEDEEEEEEYETDEDLTENVHGGESEGEEGNESEEVDQNHQKCRR